MTHLGDFGVERAPADLTFGWFGSTIRVHPDLSDLALVDLFSSMTNADDAGAALDAVLGVARTLVHPDDVDEFWTLARSHRQTMEDISTLAAGLIEAVTARPTSLPSDSSGGQQRTGTRSTGGSSSPAMRALDGRPDLQVAVLRKERQAG